MPLRVPRHEVDLAMVIAILITKQTLKFYSLTECHFMLANKYKCISINFSCVFSCIGGRFVVMLMMNRSRRYKSMPRQHGCPATALLATVMREGSIAHFAWQKCFGVDVESIGCVVSESGKVLVCDPTPTHYFSKGR